MLKVSKMYESCAPSQWLSNSSESDSWISSFDERAKYIHVKIKIKMFQGQSIFVISSSHTEAAFDTFACFNILTIGYPS